MSVCDLWQDENQICSTQPFRLCNELYDVTRINSYVFIDFLCAFLLRRAKCSRRDATIENYDRPKHLDESGLADSWNNMQSYPLIEKINIDERPNECGVEVRLIFGRPKTVGHPDMANVPDLCSIFGRCLCRMLYLPTSLYDFMIHPLNDRSSLAPK